MDAIRVAVLAVCIPLGLVDSGDSTDKVARAAQGSIIDLTDIPPSLAEFNAQPGFGRVNADAAQSVATGYGQSIAVLDTGFDNVNIDPTRVFDAYDFVDGDNDVSETFDGLDQDGDGVADDARGHGTAVLSLLMALAPDAHFGLYRVMDAEGTASTKLLALAVDTARRAGAKVINVSVNCDYDDPILHGAISEAVARGVVVVAAGANEPGQELPYPARYPECISVSSSTLSDVPYMGATQGEAVDVIAPGVGVVVAFAGSPTGFARATGTSFASPFVSAGAALLLQQFPGIDAATVRERLMSRADVVGSLTTATASPTGRRLDLGASVMP
ncbi:MAG: S8 family serine peptidase [Planctomycetota bacterium]